MAGKSTFKIREVCQHTDTQPYVLRFWESEFPQLRPETSSSGQRVYTQEDVDLILRIKQLLYDEEYTIAGARALLDDEKKRRSSKRRSSAARKVAEVAEAAEVEQRRAEADEAQAHAAPLSAEPMYRGSPGTIDRERYENAVREIQRLRLDQTRLREERDEQANRARDLERLCETQKERSERVARRLEALLERVAGRSTADA
jgi:DNA-binding transcriptional MerR regulator